MNRSILLIFGAALVSACNLGPKVCSAEDPDYLCDGNILVFCQQALPEVRLDCDGFPEARTCSDEFQECVKDPVCGNGVLEDDEECDDNNNISDDGCSDVCDLESICGNGSVDPGEQCDDGGTVANDGCNPTCQIEARDITCTPGQALGANDFNVPDGFVLRLSGECTSKAVILEPNLIIEPIPGQTASFVGDTNLTIGDADPATPPVTVVFRDIDFEVDTRGKMVVIFGNSNLAIVNATMSNADPDKGSRLVSCNGASKVLLNRITADGLANDAGFKAEAGCSMLISNSQILKSVATCNGPLEVKASSMQVILSTFANNKAALGIGKADASSTLALNGVISNQEATIPPFDSPSIPRVSGDNNLIEGVNFTGNINEDPSFDGALPTNVKVRDAVDITNIDTIFDPAVIFGINIFAVDRQETARSNPTDMGAFEL